MTSASFLNRFPEFREQLTPALGTSARLPSLPGYEVLGVLGRGGMGVVYLARQSQLGRLVALKVILAGTHASPEDQERFRAEARTVATLQHPNIVQMHDVGSHDGQVWLTLEYCADGTLAEKLHASALPVREAAELVRTLALAIHVAHQRQIIHRDLKPANVLLVGTTPKIRDFGLAKQLDASQITRSGAVLGTPSYMASEQAQGKPALVGPPTDVYALGAILYECLTGRPPFKAATAFDTMMQVIADEPVAPRHLQPCVSRDLETISLKCLQKDPRERYASAQYLADDLGRFLDGLARSGRLASFKSANQEYQELQGLRRQAETLREPLASLDDTLRQPAEKVPELLTFRALTLVRRREFIDASLTADVLADWKPTTSNAAYDAACVHALIAAPAAQRPLAVRDRHTVRSLQLLRQAVRLGSRNLAHLRRGPDLAALRSLLDFQVVERELAALVDREKY